MAAAVWLWALWAAAAAGGARGEAAAAAAEAGAKVGPQAELTIFKQSEDPLGNRDSFADLDEDTLARYWSHERRGGSVRAKLNALRHLESDTYVDVKLVGFEGDGEAKIKLLEHDFVRFFDTLHTETRAHVSGSAPDDSHMLALRLKTFFQVLHAKKSLYSSLSDVYAKALESGSTIYYEDVDEVIRDDYEDSGLMYTIYLVNMANPSADKREYRFASREGGPMCGPGLFVGQERYMWIDLNAGPVEYGPQMRGDGYVTQYVVPALRNYRRGRKGELNVPELVVDLVSLVRTTTELLITPDLHHFPVPMSGSVTFLLFYVYDSDVLLESSMFDWETITEQLQSVMHLPGQNPQFKRVNYLFRECEFCVSAYNHALRTFTYVDPNKGIFVQEPYLDAHELHHWLSHFSEILLLDEVVPLDNDQIPIFVFDLSTSERVLLDQSEQAMAFDDMVIGVQSQYGLYPSGMVCESREMLEQSGDATRATLGAILSTAFAVTPTHQHWDPLHERLDTNYLWSGSNTPYGPFSGATTLSFSQRDAAVRHVLFSYVNTTLSDLGDVLRTFARYEREVDEAMGEREHLTFLRRWNVFAFKLERASTYLSLHNYKNAFYYLRSMRHDARAIKELVSSAGATIHSVWICENDDNAAIETLSLVGIAVFVLVLAYDAVSRCCAKPSAKASKKMQ